MYVALYFTFYMREGGRLFDCLFLSIIFCFFVLKLKDIYGYITMQFFQLGPFFTFVQFVILI